MIDTEELTAEERDLRSGLLGAAGSAQLGGAGTRALHPPSPHSVVIAGRRARSRRRAGAVSMVTAAALSIGVAGVGVGSGSLTLPWLRADRSASPGTLYASPGTPVGDVVNAIDDAFGSYEMLEGGVWWYASGPVVPDRPAPGTVVDGETGLNVIDANSEAEMIRLRKKLTWLDRVVRLSVSTASSTQMRADFTLSRTGPGGGDESAPEALGSLALDDAGRGTWLQVRPSQEDGWLLFALLPANASAVQIRVAGTDVVLPLDNGQANVRPCIGADVLREGEVVCKGGLHGPLVGLRIATADSRPPIDAITYIDQDGRYVTLDAADQVH